MEMYAIKTVKLTERRFDPDNFYEVDMILTLTIIDTTSKVTIEDSKRSKSKKCWSFPSLPSTKPTTKIN